VGDPVRIGLVGYGLGGRAFHAPLITSTPDLELVGVVTTNAERCAQLAEDHQEVPAVGDIHDLHELGAHAVAISSTTGTHAELAHTALELGLHVVVDKPLAVDAATAAAVVAHAERSGLLVTAYQNRRWDSDFLTVRRLLHDRTLGEVFRFESRFERWAPGPPRAAWRSALTPAEGGGLRLDLVTHLADQAHVLFGPVASVYAEASIHRPGARAEDDITVLLTHESGVSTHLHASSWSGDTTRRFRVFGTEGTYVIGGIDGQEHALRSGRTPAHEGDRWGLEPIETWGHVHRGDEHEVVVTERGRWDTFYPAFATAVRGEGPLPVDPYDAVEVLRVLDAAALSAAEHRVVLVEEIS
jgi:predicted dehydrogenase